jgi:DNA (cytosine-5)-methyltransferase 1
MAKKILVADLFCGAGGSSTGARNALAGLGLEMELVVLNHWPTAIETHTKNHPEARHYCQDIATIRPHIAVPEGYLDLLMASPTCTHHSVARGGKPTSDQQRSDPWHVITWFTELRVKRAIIENVPEFVSWGPVSTVDHRR